MFVLKTANTATASSHAGECEQAAAATQSIGQIPSGKAAEAKAAHERRHDDRDRVDVGAAEEGQQALPDDLIQERGETAGEEDEKERDAAKTEFGCSGLAGAHDGIAVRCIRQTLPCLSP